MTLAIAGMGWVTPLGSGISPVWERLRHGDEAVATSIAGPEHCRSYRVFRVPPEATADLPAHPRLRRSSAISRFAVAAGLAALREGGVTMNVDTAERTALIFAISNGGVVYTKRFYHEVVESGARAASPLLFPETVFNAPASHLAAIMGITGASYTLVGDGAIGILALKMAQDLMANDQLDRVLVVGAEEADWLLCDAYRRWRLLRANPPIEPFATSRRGMILSEGAGALLLDRKGSTQIEKIAAGGNFSHQRDAASCVAEVFAELTDTPVDLVVASANGTFIDNAEHHAAQTHCPAAEIYAPKAALGESVGASTIWQTICAASALRTQSIPPILHCSSQIRQQGSPLSRVLVSACGLNQQVAGLRLRRVG